MAKILNRNNKGMQTCTCRTCNSEIGYWFHEVRLEFQDLIFMKQYELGLNCPHCNEFIGLISMKPERLDDLVSKSRIGTTKELFLLNVLKDKTKVSKIRDNFLQNESHEYRKLINKSDLVLLRIKSLYGQDKYIVIKDRYRDVLDLFFSERFYNEYIDKHNYNHIQIITKYGDIEGR